MKEILFASRNPGKIREIRSLLEGVNIRSLLDYPELPEIVEDGNSFLENALKKAGAVSALTGKTVLADDSGLEVAALNGAPGIRSARYAGRDADDRQNIGKLLDQMMDVPTEKRGAAFRCVLVLYRPDGDYEFFDGSWEGRISESPSGEGGFGYDPVFFLPGEGMTVAQLPPGVKNRISHRAQAIQTLKEMLLREGACRTSKRNGA